MSTFKKIKIFISHSWKDKDFAEKLSKALSEHCDVWMDYRQLRIGDNIQKTIDEALQDMDFLLVI